MAEDATELPPGDQLPEPLASSSKNEIPEKTPSEHEPPPAEEPKPETTDEPAPEPAVEEPKPEEPPPVEEPQPQPEFPETKQPSQTTTQKSTSKTDVPTQKTSNADMPPQKSSKDEMPPTQKSTSKVEVSSKKSTSKVKIEDPGSATKVESSSKEKVEEESVPVEEPQPKQPSATSVEKKAESETRKSRASGQSGDSGPKLISPVGSKGEGIQEGHKSKTERLSKAKGVVGSQISIRRLSITGEYADRKGARFMNSYKLDPDNPFNPEKVEKILEAVMTEALENQPYEADRCAKQAKWASSAIRAKVKELQFDRYKLICLVTIGEKNSQDIFSSSRFLWDAERDRYATFSNENTYVYGIAQCFGIYYE